MTEVRLGGFSLNLDASSGVTASAEPGKTVISGEESDLLRIKPLGAGAEVGRSCILMEFKGKRLLLDMGIHPGYSGYDSLPFLDMVDPATVDLLLVSHFHLDHSGALPWFLTKTTFRGRCFMTHASKAIYRWLLADYIKVSHSESLLFTEQDLEKSMTRIETVDFHEERDVDGVRYSCYPAGHVLGAAMILIEISGVKVLYTGDFSREEDRHLAAAEIPPHLPHVLICEATYGTHIHEARSEREARFTGVVYDTVTRGGRVLIPVFALGRAQELLLILDEFWAAHPEIQEIPIYYASSLANRCMAVYQTYINAMNERIRRQMAMGANPFRFKHISNLRSAEHLDDVGPAVVLASPGMLQSGLSRQLFEAWCESPRNTVLIAGYCVEGTLAKDLLREPQEVISMNGAKLQRRCQIEYISFSAHTDYKQTSEFIRKLRPPHIVLVHGESNEMSRLKAALQREYEDEARPPVVYNPKNTISVDLHFRGEKTAKVMGSLAADSEADRKEKIIRGLLVKRNFNYHILAPSDLAKYTDLATSTISQRLAVPVNLSTAETCDMAPIEQITAALSSLAVQLKSSERLLVDSCITVSLPDKSTKEGESRVALLEWVASPAADMLADAVTALLLDWPNSLSGVHSGDKTADVKLESST